MADEIAFNQEHGLMTQYDTPQAEAANRRVDNPSARAMDLQVTRKAGANDIITFGTGDNLNAVTMTADAKFVRGASAQGVDFDVYVHQPVPLQGK